MSICIVYLYVKKGHSANASSVVFHPESTLSLDPKVCNLVSTAFDGTVCLWNLEELSEIKYIYIAKLTFK